MKFVFYHHEVHGPLDLGALHAGEALFGGSVGRLRLLFWIAARGHPVELVGNVIEGEYKGVRAVAGVDRLPALLAKRDPEGCVLVLNNPPDEDAWRRVRAEYHDHVRPVLWAGNPVTWTWLRRVATGELDRIACISHSHREAYRLYRGFERLEMVYTGVDVDLLDAAPPRPARDRMVLSISMPRRTKGFHHLLRAWRSVRAAVPDATLRVCGSTRMHDPAARVGRTGVLDAELEAEFPEFFGGDVGAPERAGIELMGARALTDVYSDLKAAAVAVVNCNWRGALETFCRSAVDAQMAGTPVVGAARGSLPEVVAHERSGLLVEREDPEALAQAIILLLNDRALRQRMGTAGRTWARQFADYAAIAGDWEAIGRRALRHERAPAPPRAAGDLLRRVGYGTARLWARGAAKRLLRWS